MILITLFLGFFIGISLASYANMWAYRHPPDRNLPVELLRAKRSYCDYCYQPLKWWQNIPILSYLYLGGKTYCCHRLLPLKYPLLELAGGLSGLLAVYGWLRFFDYNLSIISGLALLILFFLLLLSLVIVSYDVDYLMIPIQPLLMMFGLSLIFYFLFFHRFGLWPIGASFINAAFMFFLYAVTRGKGMGLGDILLVMVFPFVLGFVSSVAALWLAFVLGAIFGLGLMLVKKGVHLKTLIPLGPFLIFSFWLSWAFQWWQVLIQWS